MLLSMPRACIALPYKHLLHGAHAGGCLLLHGSPVLTSPVNSSVVLRLSMPEVPSNTWGANMGMVM